MTVLSRRSAWRGLAAYVSTVLELPPLEDVVLPNPVLAGQLLNSRLSWLVAPPKCGKSLLSYYFAYLHTLSDLISTPSTSEAARRCIVSVDGPAECARGVDMAIEAPYGRSLKVAIFENPFGVEVPRPNAAFVEQLVELRRSRPDLTVLITSRPEPFLANEDATVHIGGYRSPMGVSDWYPPETLEPYIKRRCGDDLPPRLRNLLASPALVNDFANHRVEPQDPVARQRLRQRLRAHADDMAIDKFSALSDKPELATTAALIRLQEYAPAIPSAAELSLLVRDDLLAHPHLSLIARAYEFDGVARLRFEHAVAREAADLVLADLASTDFEVLRGLATATNLASWIPRAISLWQGQRHLISGDWSAFADLSEDIRITLAAETVALSDDLNLAVNALRSLDFDAWTAQDLAYELTAIWPEVGRDHSAQELRDLVLNRPDIDGAYGLLEALLYIRNPSVAELWDSVDAALNDVAARPDGARQVALAVDALAWRPPPSSQRLGKWVTDFLGGLTPASPEWGFVRFLDGYHPEGVKYLDAHCQDEMSRLILEDRRVTWTRGHADFARWLVKWHFVHQSRARAQLAHQPWIDQQFLCRSFHDVVPDASQDIRAARLIDSLAEAADDGWGYFLSENIRAVASESYGAACRSSGVRSLSTATPGAAGVLAAVLTYPPSAEAAFEMRRHFETEESVAILMRTLVEGMVVDNTRLLEPRFSYRRSLTQLYVSCGLTWDELKAAIPRTDLLDLEGRFDVERIIARFREAAEASKFNNSEPFKTMLGRVMNHIEAGDFRGLTKPALQRKPSGSGTGPAQTGVPYDSPYVRILDAAVANMLESTHG